MRKTFELSAETSAIVTALAALRMGEQMTFAELAGKVGFRVNASTSAYQSAKKVAERDHGVYIGTIRGVGFFRGTGDDMADSLDPLAARIRKTAKRSVARADLAIRNNLSEEKYRRTIERRQRASIIYSTTAAPMPASNRAKAAKAKEAPPTAPYLAISKLAK